MNSPLTNALFILGKACPDIAVIPNMRVMSAAKAFHDGDKVSMDCDLGYKVNETIQEAGVDSDITYHMACVGGEWNKPMPNCERK